MINTRIVILVALISIVACQRPEPLDSAREFPAGEGLALIQAADGTLYAAECLKTHGFGNMAGCKFEPPKASEGLRGHHNNGYYGQGYNYGGNYYDYSNPYSYYYTLFPPNYSQDNFCNSWFGTGSCYSNFGYGNNYDYSSYYQSDCDSYCYGSLYPGRCNRKCWKNSWWY
jgi:hypothetical protein